MSTAHRRIASRNIVLDRSLERLPLFRLSDSPDDPTSAFTTESGGRWRVLPGAEGRLPGTFDQDVYVEIMRRYHDADMPADGAISFTLHAFLHSMGRRVDGRTYEQLRAALVRLERTVLESAGAYFLAARGEHLDGQFTLLSAVSIERRRAADRDQFALFDTTTAPEPGEARVILAAPIRENVAARHVVTLAVARYLALDSPVARRLYRLLEVARADGHVGWRISLDRLKELLPLVQRYPSHLLRVLQPAHDALVQTGVLRSATTRQERRQWYVDYVLGSRTPPPGTAEGDRNRPE
ncbi:MAG: replication initiator protein A [Gemmatimonadaceae bacterium]